jgi:hypothetical protein
MKNLKWLLSAAALVLAGGAQAASSPLVPKTGTITTQNLVAGGTATAGSCVETDVATAGAFKAQVTGTYTAAGGLSLRETVNGTVWITDAATTTFTRQSTGVATATITSGEQDIYLVAVTGARRIGICAAGAVTGTATVTIQPIELSLGGGASSGGGGAVTNAGTFAVQPAGSVAHDGAAAGVNPVLIGGYASAAAPSNVSATNDSVRAWYQLSGAAVTQPTYAGVLAVAGSGVNGTGVQRVTIATDDTIIASANTKLDTLNTSINTTDAVTTATLANVAASASSVTCLASNASRKRAIILNDSATATLYVKPGATASATSHTWQVPPGGSLTLDNFPIYTGILDCIWSAASGSARVTEF